MEVLLLVYFDKGIGAAIILTYITYFPHIEDNVVYLELSFVSGDLHCEWAPHPGMVTLYFPLTSSVRLGVYLIVIGLLCLCPGLAFCCLGLIFTSSALYFGRQPGLSLRVSSYLSFMLEVRDI